METQCRVVGVMSLIFGMIGSFIVAKDRGMVLRETLYSYREERNWPLTVGLFVACVFSSYLVFVLFMSLADMLENIAILRSNVGYTNEVTSIFADEKKDEKLLKDGGWKCEKCGKVNASYVGTCSCGNSKP